MALLNLLHTRLIGQYVVVWFDAWQHSRLSPPWWALLTAVRHAIIRDRAWWARWWFRLRETVARARSSGAPYLLALTLLLVLAGGLGLAVRWGLGVTRQPADLLKVLAPALTYTMLRAVRTLEGITVESDTLALWTILRLRWPAVADYLQNDPDAVKGILEPLWCTDCLPAELHAAAKSPELRRIVTHPQGGPLTAAKIRQSCGIG